MKQEEKKGHKRGTKEMGSIDGPLSYLEQDMNLVLERMDHSKILDSSGESREGDLINESKLHESFL
jgi:hypothetical protein